MKISMNMAQERVKEGMISELASELLKKIRERYKKYNEDLQLSKERIKQIALERSRLRFSIGCSAGNIGSVGEVSEGRLHLIGSMQHVAFFRSCISASTILTMYVKVRHFYFFSCVSFCFCFVSFVFLFFFHAFMAFATISFTLIKSLISFSLSLSLSLSPKVCCRKYGHSNRTRQTLCSCRDVISKITCV